MDTSSLEMRPGEVMREEVMRELHRLAFARPNDAVALACGQQYGAIGDMDLAAVAEFKYKEGAAEVKFVDRVRALQVLGELLSGASEKDGAAAQAFFKALENSAENEGE